ncbi:MAG: CBS domain-containing protein [Gammaproteobacteria bacterium]
MRLWILIASFFGLLFLITFIDAKINGGFKIETTWVAIALAPTLIWLLSSGQLAELSGFGVAFKLREAIARPFSLNLDGLKIEPEVLPANEKEGISEIPKFIEKRVTAMTLQVGRRGYYFGPAIMEYLDRLTRYDFFRYVVFIDGAGKFIGLVPARTFYDQLRTQNIDIVSVIEQGDIKILNGLVTNTVSNSNNKREVLEKMAKGNVAELPVVDDENRFIGIIDRDKLTSSIVLALVAESTRP